MNELLDGFFTHLREKSPALERLAALRLEAPDRQQQDLAAELSLSPADVSRKLKRIAAELQAFMNNS